GRRAAARRPAAARIPCRGCGARRAGGPSAARARARTPRTGTGSSAGTGTGGTAGAGTGGTAGTWPGVVPHHGLDRDLDVHDAAHRIGQVLRGGAAMERVDQALGAEADHERAAVHTVDVAVLGDQRPAGPTDLLQLVEDRGPVAAHLIRLDAPGRRLRRRRRLLCRCRRLLLCRGVLRGCLLGSRLLRSRLLRRARAPRTLRTGALSRGALRAAL